MQAVLPRNPFGSAQALANSSYGAFRDGKLVRPLGGSPTGIEEFVHDSFRALVLNPKFSCVAAKSAINLGNYRIGNYAEMGAQPSMEGLAHDLYAFLLTPCSQETFSIIYKNDAPHPSCFGNLVKNLEAFGIRPHQIPTTFNVFMNVMVGPGKGVLTIGPPRSKAGDYTEFRAEMDLIVGVTACSAEMSNNYSFKPIDVAIYA